MAKFLTTTGVGYEIENIIRDAKKKLVLVSPYVQINKMLLERLQNASDKNVQITFIYGKKELGKTEKSQLEKIQNLKLYFYENLHAKCYFNEKMMVVTSMNLYDFSERNNREMGILVSKIEDLELFNDAVAETFEIVKSAEAKLKKEISILPLKAEHFSIIHDFFDQEFTHCKVNSTKTYVFCSDFFDFGNVMIREGFEIRLYHNLYNEKLIIDKIKNLKFKDLNDSYKVKFIDDSFSNKKLLIYSEEVCDLKSMLSDYNKIYSTIVNETRRISTKRKFYM